MNIAKMIDHTLLKADATKEQVVTLCEEAKQYVFASVCVNPTWVKVASELLSGTEVKVCTVIGFPLGATTSATKAFETEDASNTLIRGRECILFKTTKPVHVTESNLGANTR